MEVVRVVPGTALALAIPRHKEAPMAEDRDRGMEPEELGDEQATADDVGQEDQEDLAADEEDELDEEEEFTEDEEE